MSGKMWDEITCTVEVWVWKNNFLHIRPGMWLLSHVSSKLIHDDKRVPGGHWLGSSMLWHVNTLRPRQIVVVPKVLCLASCVT